MNKVSKAVLISAFLTAAALPFLLPKDVAHPSAPAIAHLSPLEDLGKNIFFDPSLSEPPGISCASCHDPAAGFSGNNGGIHGVARGAKNNVEGTRNTPNISYISFTPPFHVEKDEEGADLPVGGFFHDGRVSTLEEQALKPLLHPREMNNGTLENLADKLSKTSYADDFKTFGNRNIFSDVQKTTDLAARALSAFEKTAFFQPFSSKFDNYIRGTAQLTEQEKRGLDVFMDEKKGNCAACHTVDIKGGKPEKSLFTDYTYDNLGVPRNQQITDNANSDFYDLGLCGPERTAPNNDPSFCGAFKVPTLRNVAKKTAFFHNGAFNDLRDVVKFYATRDTHPENWYKNGAVFDDLPPQYRKNVNTSEIPYDKKKGETPHLNDNDIDAIVAFLKTLSDGNAAP